MQWIIYAGPTDRSVLKMLLGALCTKLVSRLHTTAASTFRLTPHAVLYSLFS